MFWKKITHFARLKMPVCFIIRQNPFVAHVLLPEVM